MAPLVPKLVCLGIFLVLLCGLSIQGHETENLETECRPYVEKALKEQLEHADPAATLLESSESQETLEVPDDGNESAETEQNSKETVEEASTEDVDETQEVVGDVSGETEEKTEDEADSAIENPGEDTDTQPEDANSSETEDQLVENSESIEQTDETKSEDEQASTEEETLPESNETEEATADQEDETPTENEASTEAASTEGDASTESQETVSDDIAASIESQEQADAPADGSDETKENQEDTTESIETDKAESEESTEQSDEATTEQSDKESEQQEIVEESKEDTQEEGASKEDTQEELPSEEGDSPSKEETQEDVASKEDTQEELPSKEDTQEDSPSKEDTQEDSASKEDTQEDSPSKEDTQEDSPSKEDTKEDSSSKEEAAEEIVVEEQSADVSEEAAAADELAGEEKESESIEEQDEDELTKEFVIPEIQRPRNQLIDILHLDEESSRSELALAKAADATLRELKRLYDTAIKPLEILYKYRDLSNRHFGDPEIFSKPLILFMGPWSGGKSSIINYLLDNEYNENSLRTGAEPSPAYFNIVTWGPEPEILDGTQLAADWTFSGLQKFGQGLEDRLRGLKLPNKLLEMVNIVEIPGILEVRKQVSRVFPFNDACQWFIDRADIIFLVYDPSKLDVGPETEAILDQLKGREYQTRVILNKADTVKPEELLRVQGALLWNISPLMSSAQPPIIYTTSLWSTPYNPGSPVKLLQAQERAFLRDIRSAIDKRIDNKIASARRFAVRVRNHAKMVDCYLTTYFNHKTFFGNRKQTADDIIENPQSYHIYEGLSTLKNISRYDLPDPDTYRDFFKVNPLYDFQQLSSTCTYFKGCPINRLDVCIAYDLPELVGKHKKSVEQSMDSKLPLNS